MEPFSALKGSWEIHGFGFLMAQWSSQNITKDSTGLRFVEGDLFWP